MLNFIFYRLVLHLAFIIPHIAFCTPLTQDEVDQKFKTAARQGYAIINKNWSMQKPCEPLKFTSDFWKFYLLQSSESIEQRNPTFVLRSAIFPENFSTVVDDLINKPAIAECNIALQAVNLFTLKEILGSEVFNRVAKKYYDEKIKDDKKNKNNQFIRNFVSYMLDPIKIFPPSSPSFCYITNIKMYSTLKPTGLFHGENLLYLGGDNYFGFGDFFRNGPQSLKNIENHLYKDFCSDKNVDPTYKEQHKQLVQKFTADPKIFLEMRQNNQKEEQFNVHMKITSKTISFLQGDLTRFVF